MSTTKEDHSKFVIPQRHAIQPSDTPVDTPAATSVPAHPHIQAAPNVGRALTPTSNIPTTAVSGREQAEALLRAQIAELYGADKPAVASAEKNETTPSVTTPAPVVSPHDYTSVEKNPTLKIIETGHPEPASAYNPPAPVHVAHGHGHPAAPHAHKQPTHHTTTPEKAVPAVITGEYAETHSETADHKAAEASSEVSTDWQRYHSEWQKYYQQYYERYYVSQLIKKQSEIESGAAERGAKVASTAPAVISKNQAVNEVKSELMGKIQSKTEKIRASRHFMPALMAIVVALVFLFLQYNQLFIAQIKAFAVPAASSNNAVVDDPTVSTKVSDEPRVTIPLINVDAPVVYGITDITNEHDVQANLKNGVVHYPIAGASAVPGEKGNSVFLGHSSNDVFDDGKYKFVFLQLDKLQVGNIFHLNYKGTKYTYKVTKSETIEPTEVSKLVTDNTKPVATLVTCTPAGTALHRLVVWGEQISPDPNAAAAAPTTDTTTKPSNSQSISGSAPSFLERIFNWGGSNASNRSTGN